MSRRITQSDSRPRGRSPAPPADTGGFAVTKIAERSDFASRHRANFRRCFSMSLCACATIESIFITETPRAMVSTRTLSGDLFARASSRSERNPRPARHDVRSNEAQITRRFVKPNRNHYILER